jgi:hypothetical protein
MTLCTVPTLVNITIHRRMFTILFLPYVNAVIQNSNIGTYYFFKGHILKCLVLLGFVELKISVFLNEDVYNITISV